MMSRLKSVSATLLCFGIFGWNVGCAPSEEKGTVIGSVTLDGTPLASGAVRFVPLAGDAPTAGANIAEGNFTAKVPFGEMRVEFTASKIVGTRKMYEGMPDSPDVDIVEERIPAKYNVRTTLTLGVRQGSQEASFSLESR